MTTPKTLAPCDHDECGLTECRLATEELLSVDQRRLVRPFVVSIVMLRDLPNVINTQNKLYPLDAVSEEEAVGKAVLQSAVEFPDHRYHTACVLDVEAWWPND